MGEAEFKSNGMASAVMGAVSEMAVASDSEMRLMTPGGRYQARTIEGGAGAVIVLLAGRPWPRSFIDKSL